MKLLAALVLLLPVVSTLEAQSTTQSFEGFADSFPLTNQISGLNFAGATVLTAGITLNEAQFPPHTGVNVISNVGSNTITITFAPAVPTVIGFYTYATPITVQALNASSVQVASATSLYSNNTVQNGAAGSSPNEQFTVSSPGGIATIILTSSTSNSFTLDDLTYGNIVLTSVPTLSVPAMSGLVFLLAILGCLAAGKQARAVGMIALIVMLTAAVPHGDAALTSSLVSMQPPSPQGFPLNTPTQVTFSCTIQPNSTALPNSVTLVRIDTNPATLIGKMTLNNGVYSLTTTITVTNSNSTQQYQCTVGNGVQTVRSKSNSYFVGEET